MGDHRSLTQLYESRAYIADMKAQLIAVNNTHSKVRLGLHIYCHLFEMDEFYPDKDKIRFFSIIV
jgi:hypothetical protein